MSVRDSMEFAMLHYSVNCDTLERVKVKKLSRALKTRTPISDFDKFVNFLSNV